MSWLRRVILDVLLECQRETASVDLWPCPGLAQAQHMDHAQCGAQATPASRQHQALVLSMSGHLLFAVEGNQLTVLTLVQSLLFFSPPTHPSAWALCLFVAPTRGHSVAGTGMVSSAGLLASPP